MSPDDGDAIRRAQQEVVNRLTDVARALVDLNPLLHPGRTAASAVQPVQHLLEGFAGYAELAVGPLTEFVDQQRELAERMAAWAELQHDFANQMAAWAALQRRFADSLATWLAPVAEGSRRVTHLLGEVADSTSGDHDDR